MNEAEVPVIAAGLAALGQLRMVGAAARVLRYGEHHGLIFCDDVAEPRRQTNYDLATSRGFLSIQNDSAWPGMLAKLEDFSSREAKILRGGTVHTSTTAAQSALSVRETNQYTRLQYSLYAVPVQVHLSP